jgi:hypothetical protein
VHGAFSHLLLILNLIMSGQTFFREVNKHPVLDHCMGFVSKAMGRFQKLVSL